MTVGGIAAYGRCDDIEIEVLSRDADDRLELQLLTVSATFRFVIAGPSMMGEMVRFLESQDSAGAAELEVGRMDRAAVEMGRDRSSGTARVWLRVCVDGGHLRLDFTDDKARGLIAAIRDADRDLVSSAHRES